MKLNDLSKPIYLNIVRISLCGCIMLLITNSLFEITNNMHYLILGMIISVITLGFTFIMFLSRHKYTLKELLGIKKCNTPKKN